jgi:hypothetical protein
MASEVRPHACQLGLKHLARERQGQRYRREDIESESASADCRRSREQQRKQHRPHSQPPRWRAKISSTNPARTLTRQTKLPPQNRKSAARGEPTG